MRAILRLQVHLRVYAVSPAPIERGRTPIAVHEDDGVGRGERDADAARARREQEHVGRLRSRLGVEGFDLLPAVVLLGRPVDAADGPALHSQRDIVTLVTHLVLCCPVLDDVELRCELAGGSAGCLRYQESTARAEPRVRKDDDEGRQRT